MRQKFSYILCLVTLLLLVVVGGVAASGANRVLWLSAENPTVAELLTLPSDEEPLSKSYDCDPQVVNGISACVYDSPFGRVARGILVDGPKGPLTYEYTNGGAVMPSVPNRPSMLITETNPRNWTYGKSIQIGTYDSAALQYKERYGLPTIKTYVYSGPTGTVLTAPDGTVLNFGAGDIAYSANGKWMVAVLNGGGIIRYDLDTLQGKVLAWDAQGYSTSAAHNKTNNLAVSNDGRFVAVTQSVSTTDGTRPSLRVYDAESCKDQYAYKAVASNACEYKDLWTGEYRTGNSQGLRDMLPTAEYPRRIRFPATDTITFDTIFNRTSTASYSVARFRAKAGVASGREYVGLLGMGDSYISGEGASGTYFEGTDTKQNKCHLSWFSYPFRIGAKQFPYGRSVACSGARMLDVTVAAGDPEGLIKGEKTAGNYVGKDKIKWNERSLIEQKSVLDAFSPGYANQAIFASEYKPRVILLSIGGNDVGFANIVRTCIDFGEIPETCYQYYENRLQVMKTIQSQYYRLVKTYKDVRSASGGARVYVMAYPQIAKEGGNCGNNVRLTAKEVQFSAQLVSYLNSIIKRAAAEAGVYYVDTENALSGHRLCEASGSQLAVNGLTNGDDLGLPAGVQVGSKKYYAALGQESYHPNRYGHNLMGQVILAKTNNLTVTMPSPTMLGIPAIDLNSPMLKNMPHAPEQQLHTEAIQWADTSDMPAVLIQQNQYTTQIKPGTLAPSSNVQIVIHSEPVVLYEGTYMEGMQVRFSVPGSLAPGFHTIDIYGTSSDGERVDYRQLVYIAASVDDYDGDDVPNATDPCVSAYQAGEDTDADGIDDACDGLIAAPSSIAPEEVPELPVSSPLTLETSDEVNPYEDGLVAPYMEPVVEEPNPTNDDSASDQETPLVTPVITTASGSATSNTLASVQQLARGNVAAYFGYALTPDEETVPANAAAPDSAHAAVLGETAPSNVPHSIVVPGSKNVQKTGTTKFVYAAIFAAILVLLVWRVRIRRKAA